MPDFRHAAFADDDLDPLAVYPPGTRLTDLRTAESLLVVALRLWTAARLEPQARYGDWRDGFRAGGICDIGAACFQAFLNIVEAAVCRPIMLGTPRCNDLTEDEARFLCVVALLQRERGHDAALLLADWLPPAAVRIAADQASGLAAALAEAGLSLPPRRPRTAEAGRFIHRPVLHLLH